MRRDMDLIRAILLEIEKMPFPNRGQNVHVSGYSPEDLCYNALLANEAGLIDAKFSNNATAFIAIRLTYAGHEFLDAARSETLWAKARTLP